MPDASLSNGFRMSEIKDGTDCKFSGLIREFLREIQRLSSEVRVSSEFDRTFMAFAGESMHVAISFPKDEENAVVECSRSDQSQT